MGFFKRLKRGVKKLGGKVFDIAAVAGVPGVGLARRAHQAAKSFGEDTKKLRLAKKANLKAGIQLRDPVAVLAGGPARRIKAPRVTLGPSTAAKARTRIREGQALRVKAGKVSRDRQELLHQEWEALGKPGSWEDYLLENVRQGLG